MVRQGLQAPYVTKMANLSRPEEGEMGVMGYGTFCYTLSAEHSPYPGYEAPDAPRALHTELGLGSIVLNWEKGERDVARGYEVYRSTDGVNFEKLTSWDRNTRTNYTDTDVEPGCTYYYKVRGTNTSGAGEFSETASMTASTVGTDLPRGWGFTDVGTVASAGSYAHTPGSTAFRLSGSGNDIGGTEDSHAYLFTKVKGEAAITAHLGGVNWGNTGTYRRIGLVVRETLKPNSRRVCMSVVDDWNRHSCFGYRTVAGCSTNYINGNDFTSSNVWFRIVRHGNTFTAYQAADTLNWAEVGSVTVPMGEDYYVGLASCANNTNGDQLAGTFDHVSVDGVPDREVSFDEATGEWSVVRGKAELSESGAWKGRALKMSPFTVVRIPLELTEGSTYELTARMRAESGADNMTLQLVGLGANNRSASTALTAWSEVKIPFNVGQTTDKPSIEVVFDGNANSNFVWVDAISVRRTGDYVEKVYDGIPPLPKREVLTDLGLAMQPDEKMQWMQDDKLGLFIHWGIYAGPGRGEWYMENNGVSIEEYRKLAYPESGDEYFDACDFDAHKWIDLAKKCGLRYACLTTQHHDGFALFESKYMNAFTSKNTLNRDSVKEYVEACREAGLKVGFYKTLINWRYPGYYDVTGTDCNPNNKFGYTTETWHKENARLMKEELYCQTKELMTNYGKIDYMYWDGGWIAQRGTDAEGAHFWESGKYMVEDSEWPVNEYFRDYDEETGKPLGLMGMVRKYQPDIVVNPRSGWIGDFTCEEGGGDITGEVRTGVVEKNLSIAPGWGYNKMMERPEGIMPLPRIKRLLADCMVRNMNFLINIGPDRHGNVAPLVEQRMLEFGEWVNATAEAIYGTHGGPWNPVDGQYGFCYRDNKLFVYFLGGYRDTSFTLPPVDKGMKARRAYNVFTKERVKVSQKGKVVTLPEVNPVENDITLIAIEFDRNIRTR